jgi:hypothetical protein
MNNGSFKNNISPIVSHSPARRQFHKSDQHECLNLEHSLARYSLINEERAQTDSATRMFSLPL